MKALAILIALGAVAHAAPGITWTQAGKCNVEGRGHVFANTDSIMWMDMSTSFKQERRTRATGAVLPVWKLKSRRPDLVALDDAFLVTRDPKGVAIVDAKTGAQLWRRDEKVEYSIPGGAIAGANIAMVRLGKGKTPAQDLELDDGQTGKAVWKVSLGTLAVHSLRAGASLVFVLQAKPFGDTATVTAFSLKDGAKVWSHDGLAAGGLLDYTANTGDELVVAGMKAVVMFDAKGTMTTVALDAPRLGVVTADRVYVTVVDKVVAIDRKTAKQLWAYTRHGMSLDQIVTATPAAVFVVDGGDLAELDAKTGKLVSALGAGNQWFVDLGAGKPALVGCTGKKLVGYDFTTAAPAIETATITGTVKCSPCQADAMWVRYADQKVPVDAKGKFSITVKARGEIALYVQFVDTPGEFAGDYSRTASVVALTGKSTYDVGTWKVEQEQEGD